jgi:hypothetical protein
VTGSKISWGNLLFLDLPKKVSDSSEVEDFVFLSFSPVGLGFTKSKFGILPHFSSSGF